MSSFVLTHRRSMQQSPPLPIRKPPSKAGQTRFAIEPVPYLPAPFASVRLPLENFNAGQFALSVLLSR